jgi:ethanolamine utilization protein EutP (predicted NTPase)
MIDAENVISLIKCWKPKKFQKEFKYKDDLSNYLSDELNKSSSSILKPDISVKRTVGKGLCDIVVNRKIGIELRKDLATKEDVDLLCQQLNSYERGYEEVIVVLLGKSNPIALEQLKDDVQIRNKTIEINSPDPAILPH